MPGCDGCVFAPGSCCPAGFDCCCDLTHDDRGASFVPSVLQEET